MAECYPIFAPEDISKLLLCDMVDEAHGGMRKLHRRMAYGSAEDEYRDLPLDITADDVGDDNSTFVGVSKLLISKAAMMYVGYIEGSNWPADGPIRETDEDDGELTVAFADVITLHMGSAPAFSPASKDTRRDDAEGARRDYGVLGGVFKGKTLRERANKQAMNFDFEELAAISWAL